VKIVNLNKDLLRCGWVVNHLPAAIKPIIPGLTASFFLKTTFSISPGVQPSACAKGPDGPSGDQPMEGGAHFGISYASDFVPVKPHGEITVVGSACNSIPPQRTFQSRFRMGKMDRCINVTGDRTWENAPAGLRPSTPVSVQSVPLSYANAWGGPNSPTNPLGCGQEGDRLPNFENVGQGITSRTQQSGPAGFAPFPPSMPFRRAKLGTYDKEWSETRWPWMPDDFDWTYFNSAPPTQWLDRYFVGNEQLELHHLHPEHLKYEFSLPSLRARCFVARELSKGEHFAEVPLDLDTVWVDMAQEKLILVWRGRCEVSSLKLRDVKSLLILLEPLRTPRRTDLQYAELLAQGLDRTSAKRPPVKIPDLAKGKAEAEAILAPYMAERSKMLKQMAELETSVQAGQTKAIGEAGGSLPTHVTYSESIAQLKDLLAEKSSEPGMTAQHQQALADAVARIEEIGDPQELIKMKQAEAEARLATLPRGKSRKLKVDLRNPDALAAARTAGFVNMDLEGADFSHLDVAGIDFSGSILKNTNFEGAILRRANLTGANFTNANLNGADLSEANVSSADFRHCSVEKTVWQKVCVLRARLRDLDLSGADFSYAHGESAEFQNAKLEGASFRHCDLPSSSFIGAKLDGAHFSHATLRKANFRGVQARNASFHDADLTNFRAGMGADFEGADLKRVSARGSIWKGSSLVRANFQEADLRRSIFTCAKLHGTIFDRCEMEKATMEETDLSQAQLTYANLLRTNFNRADLTDAILNGSNLYGSSMWDAILLRATWEHANVENTRLIK